MVPYLQNLLFLPSSFSIFWATILGLPDPDPRHLEAVPVSVYPLSLAFSGDNMRNNFILLALSTPRNMFIKKKKYLWKL
jgi:hypothetical protein